MVPSSYKDESSVVVGGGGSSLAEKTGQFANELCIFLALAFFFDRSLSSCQRSSNGLETRIRRKSAFASFLHVPTMLIHLLGSQIQVAGDLLHANFVLEEFRVRLHHTVEAFPLIGRLSVI